MGPAWSSQRQRTLSQPSNTVGTDLSQVLNLVLRTTVRVSGYFLILSSVKLHPLKTAAFQEKLVNDSQTLPVLTCCLTQEWVNTESGLTASQLAKTSLAPCTELCLQEREKYETRRSKRVTKLSSRCPFNTFRQVHFIHLRWEGNNLSCDSFSNREGCTAGTTGSESVLICQRCTEIASGLNVPWKYKALKGLLIEILIKTKKPLRRNISVAPPWATESRHIWGYGTLHFANAGYEDVLLFFFPFSFSPSFHWQ